MELRQFALEVVTATDLESKLRAPSGFTDEEPGAPLFLTEPGRPESLRIAYGRAPKVPKVVGMADEAQRVRILHAFANHELQAVELFAWALLAFPEAEPDFRRGLLRILEDEQRHTRMYVRLLESRCCSFGNFPVNGYFWAKAAEFSTPLRFVAAMSLTFESANLDHASDYRALALAAGDHELAGVIDVIHREEIEHVRFGWDWLNRLKAPGASAWDAYRSSLAWPLRPSRSVGRSFDEAARSAAGMDRSFLEALARDKD